MAEFLYLTKWGTDMPPLREKVSLFSRYIGQKQETVEQFVIHYIITEGEVTEQEYLRELIKSAFVVIRDNIKVIPIERTEEDIHNSAPNRLLQYAIDFRTQKNDASAKYIIMFDRDSFKSDHILKKPYLDFLLKASKNQIDILVSSPCIELWLLLHKKNSLHEIILPVKDKIFNNKRVSTHHTFTSSLCSKKMGFNPKNTVPTDLIKATLVALLQSQELTHDIYVMKDQIGTNLGEYVTDILYDPRKI
jgi:hypothetical protein